jgi:hypothetical protein
MGIVLEDTLLARLLPHHRSMLFFELAPLLFFALSISHSHAKPIVKITMTTKMAYSVIGTALSYFINIVD